MASLKHLGASLKQTISKIGRTTAGTVRRIGTRPTVADRIDAAAEARERAAALWADADDASGDEADDMRRRADEALERAKTLADEARDAASDEADAAKHEALQLTQAAVERAEAAQQQSERADEAAALVDALDDTAEPNDDDHEGANDLAARTKDELYELARERNISGRSDMNKAELIDALTDD